MATSNFEVTYILHPTLTDSDVIERSNAIGEDLKACGGAVVGEIENIGKRRLAYEIDDIHEGYYITMKFRGERDQANAFERRLRLNDKVLRHLVIRMDD